MKVSLSCENLVCIRGLNGGGGVYEDRIRGWGARYGIYLVVGVRERERMGLGLI